MFKQMKMGTKIVLALGAVVLISLAIGGIGYRGMTGIMESQNELAEIRLPNIKSLLTISAGQTAVLAGETGLINRRMMDSATRRAQYTAIEDAWKRVDASWKICESSAKTREETDAWKAFVSQWDDWKRGSKQVVDLSLEKDRLVTSGLSLDDPKVKELDEKIFQASVESRRLFLIAESALNKIVDMNEKAAIASDKSADDAASSFRMLLIAVILFGIIFSIVFGFGLSRNIDNILTKLTLETKSLVDAALAGNLDTRGNVDNVNVEFRGIIDGFNKTLDSVIGPVNVAADYVGRISRGDIPEKITETYKGDFNEIKNNLNNCIDNIKALVNDANLLAQAAVEGKLATRADATKHQGDYRKIVEGVNHTLDAVIGPLNVAAKYVDRISNGDIPEKITDTYRGDFNEIKNNLNNCIDNIKALVNDANLLAQAAVEGRLATRADATKHQGDYRKIVEGVNNTLDAVIGPLNVAAEYVDRISNGDIPPKITDTYRGDFNEIKNNLNNCIENIKVLVNDANLLAQAAMEGKLATRADATKHQGDYRKIVEGVNNTLDAVIGPLNVAAEYVDRISNGDIPPKITDTYRGDFNEIKINLNNCIDNISALVNDANLLAQAAVEGKLATRADATKHQGGLPQDRGRSEPHPGCGHRSLERGRRVRGSHQQRRHTTEDHGHIQR